MCQNLIEFLLTVTLSECGAGRSGKMSNSKDARTNCSGLSLICSGGSVNMTFSVCAQTTQILESTGYGASIQTRRGEEGQQGSE